MSFEDEVVLEEQDKKKKKKDKAIKKEYDDTFNGEEKVIHQLAGIKSKISVKYNDSLDIEDIITSNFKKISREDSLTGLTGVVGEWGVVTPIHVLALEDEDSYQILDGLRRVFAALRNGNKTIPAMIWDFTDKDEGKEVANILTLMINRNQKFTPKEMWEQMKLLETVNEASPGLIEYLLQMESGEAMKLKDVMLADDDYIDAREGLLSGKFTIEAAYKKLCALRKKEDKLAKEDGLSVDTEGLKHNTVDGVPTKSSDVSGEDSETEPHEKLGVEEVKNLLDLTDDDISDKALEDLNKTNEIRKDDMHQKPGERTYVDPNVKKATMIRDDFKCQCCGIGGIAWTSILVYHHVVPVFAGGPDTVDNGLTLCVNCHLTLHNYAAGDLQVDITELDDKDKETFKKIFKYGNVAIEASKKLGMKRKEFKDADKASRKHPMPNANLKSNKEAFEEYTNNEQD